MKGYRCKECGTGYSTTGDTPPPSPNWADGHKCEMVEVESKISANKSRQPGKIFPVGLRDGHYTQDKIEEEREARMRIIAQNGNTGEHYE